MKKQFLYKGLIGLVFLLMLAMLALPALTSTAEAQPPAGKVFINVKFKPSANSAAVNSAIQGAGGTSVRDLP